jgi:hypothetical protein
MADSAVSQMMRELNAKYDGRSPMTPAFESIVRKRIREAVPSYRIPNLTLQFGIDNSIWIRLGPEGDGTVWLILDQVGNPVGEVVFRGHGGPAKASLASVWTLRSNNGFTDVTKYRLVRGGQK